MIFYFDLELFKEKQEKFKQFDSSTFPYSFREFWKWKTSIETNKGHILDEYHRKETFRRLGETLKRWQWHRPYNFIEVAGRLKDALEKIHDAYNQVRNYSLLEFSEIPNDLLELIWHELGCVKTDEERNPTGYYLVMGTTKPLMFLWGQTLAFDSIVRKRMPRFDVRGVSGDYWNLETWKGVMMRFQEGLKRQPEVVVLLKEVSRKEYRTTSIIPYGQFLDLYYWVR